MAVGVGAAGRAVYLVCRFEVYDNERILALPRIMQAEASVESFPWPIDFDLADYCIGVDFGVSRGRKVQLRFHIDKACGQHLLESPLSSDQVVSDIGTSFEIAATVVETELLLRWLRGWGDKISSVEMMSLAPMCSRPVGTMLTTLLPSSTR